MKNFNRIALFAVLLCTGVAAEAQQNYMVQTSLAAAITNANTQTFQLASTTGITTNPATDLMVDRELMFVLAVNGTSVTVQRGMAPTGAGLHAVGAMVLAGQPNWFISGDRAGACTAATLLASPAVNIQTGSQWLCSPLTGIWGPGWQNDLYTPTTSPAVASAAGPITPSGLVFHVTGTAAITGFNLPLGFYNSSFLIIPDGIFTTTTATNIAIASTAVVGKPMYFNYDVTTSKFYPSY